MQYVTAGGIILDDVNHPFCIQEQPIFETSIKPRLKPMNKKYFVETYLKPLLINADLNIDDVAYKRTPRREMVTVIYSNGFKNNIDVTRDSPATLAADVLKNCN